jgi:hypothetical protein
MRQFAVIKNAETDEIFAIAIKGEDNLTHCVGIHPAGRQWAKSYNQGLTKSLNDDLQPGILTGSFAPLTSTMQAVIDEAMEGKSVRFPDRSRLVFVNSVDHRHTQAVPQVKDAGLHSLTLKDLRKGADYKGMTFRVDSARSSVLFKTRQGQYGYDIQGIGFISRNTNKKVLQEELTNTALGYGNVRRAVKAVAERKYIMLDDHNGYMPPDEEKFVEPVRTKAVNRLGRRLGGGGKGGVRKIGRSMQDPFDPKAWDGDGDGIVQEGTMWERPAIPGINTNLPGQPKTRTKPKDYPADSQRGRKRRTEAQRPRRDPNRSRPGERVVQRRREDQRRREGAGGMRSMYGNDPDAPFPTPADERAFDAHTKRIDKMTVNELFDMEGLSSQSERLLGQLIDEHGWDLEDDGADVDKPLAQLLKEAGGVKRGDTASKLFAELEDDFWDDPSRFMNLDEGPDPYDVARDRQMDDDASGGMRSRRGSSKPDPLWQGPDGDPYKAEQLEEVWQDRVNDVMDEQGLSEEDAIEFLAANPKHGLAAFEQRGMRSFREFDRIARQASPLERDRTDREAKEEWERLVQFLMDDSTYMNPDGLSRQEAIEELQSLGMNDRVLGRSDLGGLRKRVAEKHRSSYGFHPAGNRYRKARQQREQSLKDRFDHTSTDDMETDLDDYYRRRDSETDNAKKARWQQEINDHEIELDRREDEDDYEVAAREERIEILRAEGRAEDRGEDRAAGGMRSRTLPPSAHDDSAWYDDLLSRSRPRSLDDLTATERQEREEIEGILKNPDAGGTASGRRDMQVRLLELGGEDLTGRQEYLDRGGMRSMRDDYEPDPMDLAKANREDRLIREHTAHLTSDELIQLNETLADVLAVFEGSIYGPDEDDPDFARILKLKEAIEVALDAQDVIEIGDGMDIDDTIGTLLRVYDGVGEPWPEISDVISVLEMARDNRDGEYVSPTLTERGYMLSDEDRSVDGGMRSRRGGEPSRQETPRRQELREMSVNELRDDESVPDEALQALENTVSGFDKDDPIFDQPISEIIDNGEYFGPDDLERLLDIAAPPYPTGRERTEQIRRRLAKPVSRWIGENPTRGMRSQRGEDDAQAKKRIAREKRLQKEFEGVSDRDLEEELGELESADMLAEDDPNTLQAIKDRFGSLKKMQDRLNKLWEETDRRDAEAEDAPAPGPYDDPAVGDWVNRVRRGGMRSRRGAYGPSRQEMEAEIPKMSYAEIREHNDYGSRSSDALEAFENTFSAFPDDDPIWQTPLEEIVRLDNDVYWRQSDLDDVIEMIDGFEPPGEIAPGIDRAEEMGPRSPRQTSQELILEDLRSEGGMRSRVDSQRTRHAQRTGADDSNESYRWGGSPRPDSEDYDRRVEQVRRGGTRNRQRDAATDATAMPRGQGGMRSRRGPKSGIKRPGVDRASKKDGQIWENLTPEERKAIAEAAKVEMHRLMWGIAWNDIGVNDTRKSGDEGVSNIGNAVIRYWFNEHIRPGLSEEDAKNYVFTDENIAQIRSVMDRAVSDGLMKPIAAESMEKLLNRFDSLRTYRNMAAASEKDGDEAFAFLEHLSPSARDSLYKRAAGPDKDRLRGRTALGWNKDPSTRNESLESRQGEVGRLAGTRRGRVGSWTRDMAKRIMIPDPERARRRALKAQKRRGGSGGGGTQEQRRRSAIERAMSKAKRKARSLLRGKKDEKKVLAEADKNMGHKIVKVDADGKVELGDIKEFSKALAAYRKDPGALKVQTKGTDGKAHGEDIAAERNADMGIIWQVHGMNGLPILVSESEMEGLADQGWTMIVRGHGSGKGGVDNAENWLTDELRFLPGRGGEAYGSGEYWATGGGFASWRHAVDQNSTVALIPPTARRISQSKAHEQASANKRITEVFNLVASTYPGDEIEHADPKELAAQIRAEFDKADPRNWETEVGQLWQRLLEAMENGDPDSVNAMLMFKKISRADRNLIAPALGYDIIDVANGPTLVMNRSAMVALDGAVNEGQFQKLHRIAAQARADRRG